MALRDSGRELVSITVNLVDLLWGSERPPVPSEPIYALQEAFTGDSYARSLSHLGATQAPAAAPLAEKFILRGPKAMVSCAPE